MALTVKKKIWSGTLFLFLLLLITGSISIYYVARLKADAKNVLQANYESLSYCHTMQQQLNGISTNFSTSIIKFEKALQLQENNVTEKGEQEATNSLHAGLIKLKNSDTSRQNITEIEQQLQVILYLNMQAIKRKSLMEESSAKDALTIIVALCGLIFLIAFTFIVNFPSVITNPISQLTEAIKEISNKNYRHRIRINNRDEFGNLAQSFNDMAERLEYFESSNLNKLIFEKSRAEAVINSLKDASIGIDKNDRILFANYQALQLLGLSLQNIVGKKVDELKSINDLFNFLITNEGATPFKIIVQNRENYFIKETIEVNDGDSKSKVIVLKNITSFKELDVAKTNFIATISHELKTPLASSDFSLTLLEDERVSKLTEEQKELIKSLKQDNKRMLKILSELLNMSQIEAGKIHLSIQKVQPYQVIEYAVNAISTAAKEKNIRIEQPAAQNLPAIEADADKTTWVLNNILTNAIKYSHKNGVIEINTYQQDNKIVFSIKDQGIGIAKQYLHNLFDKYFQVPGSNVKGTGLGLSISKEFIQAQGGNIWVESELNKGSTFFFSLPLK